MFAGVSFSFFLLGFVSVLGAGVGDWAGSWTDEGDGSYGGTFKVCVDAAKGTAQGFYSDVGYVFGQVTEIEGVATWAGQWYEAGDYGYGDSWGFFFLQLSDDASSFNGTWTAANAPAEYHVWGDENIDHVVPTKDQCWAADYPTNAMSSDRTTATLSMSLHGTWEEVDVTPKWYVCVSGSTFTSSYKYYYNGELISGYVTGDVLLNGRVLMGNFYEEESRGIYLLTAATGSNMRGSWWQASELAQVNVNDINNADIHDIDAPLRLSTDADWDDCNQYACIVSGCQSDNDDDDDDDNEDAIVTGLAVGVAISGAAMIAMFVCLCTKNKQQGADTQQVQLKASA